MLSLARFSVRLLLTPVLGMLKVAVFNLFGGTGKSTQDLNLGASLAGPKRRVLLIDLDGQRTLSFALGMDGQTPKALDWLTEEGLFTPLATQTKNLSLIPGDIGLFRLSAESDLFTKSAVEVGWLLRPGTDGLST